MYNYWHGDIFVGDKFFISVTSREIKKERETGEASNRKLYELKIFSYFKVCVPCVYDTS